MAVPAIQAGQIWRYDETGEHWLVTKVYPEIFALHAVMRKVGGTEDDVRRVKVEKTGDGVALPGFVFTQEAEAF